MNLESKIEAILLFKNEPVSLAVLASLLNESKDNLLLAISNLQRQFQNRGIVIVFDGENLCFGTNPELSKLIETIQKDELQRELGRAGLETLSIVLYKGPVSRREIDYIRGVNSGFILRNLMIRGLVERAESLAEERSFSYKPTLELMRHLGIQKREDLPEFGVALQKIESFIQNPPADANE